MEVGDQKRGVGDLALNGEVGVGQGTSGSGKGGRVSASRDGWRQREAGRLVSFNHTRSVMDVPYTVPRRRTTDGDPKRGEDGVAPNG
ncbi:hypothetical protein [Nonomuraea fuscirosea]|uniref:hypothetical protein n=1 Tax=Nonomuraea fuscirosea TaxID=1291556 RepID=UPI0034141A1E